MKHDKGLLKADKLAAFREWLVAAGFEVRDGKGEFQCLQVKTSPTCWAVVGRNTAGVLSTHPELRTLINRFNSGSAKQRFSDVKGEKAFKNFHGQLCERFGFQHDPVDWWRDQVSLEEHIAQLVKHPAPALENATEEQAQAGHQQFLEDLRDDFAMHALQGLLSNPHFLQPHPDTGRSIGPKTPELALRDAYRFADAAMEARKVQP